MVRRLDRRKYLQHQLEALVVEEAGWDNFHNRNQVVVIDIQAEDFGSSMDLVVEVVALEVPAEQEVLVEVVGLVLVQAVSNQVVRYKFLTNCRHLFRHMTKTMVRYPKHWRHFQSNRDWLMVD